MADNRSHIVDTIVATLLQVGGRVLEISADCVVTNSWADQSRLYEYEEIGNDVIVGRFAAQIKDCFISRRKEAAELAVVVDKSIIKYNIKILPIHPDNGRLFVVVEFISKKDAGKVSEDYWKLALDATGDGMWDVFVNDGRISFSEKWHEVFGYNREQLSTVDQWTAIIHPEDIEGVQSRRLEYFEGRARFYHSEFRLRCEDGGYKWVLSRGVIVARNADGSPLRFTGTHTDINDRKIAEEKYFATAQLLSKLINNLREGILVTDEEKKIVYANQMFCDLYNVNEQPDALIGMSVYESVASRMPFYVDPDKFYNRTIEILDSRKITLDEEWHMTSGKILNRDHIPLVLGNNNKGGIWKFRDITAQKNAEKQISELRQFYEQILNYIGADIVVFDAQQRYLFINPNAIKNAELRAWMLGKTDEDYCRIREKAYELVERRRKIFVAARDGRKPIEWEETLVNGKGETEYHLRYLYPVYDGSGAHVFSIGYGLNITDRVKAQQELKTSMDTFASAFNDSGIGMALLSPDGSWLDANNVLCKLTGYSKEELFKVSVDDLTHPEDIGIDEPLIKRMLKREISTYSIEKRYISRYIKIVQVLLTVSLVWDNDGKPKFFIAQVLDITANKEMEWEISKKNAELEVTKENLLNKINQLEDLSHIIAHNLRGPAGNIKMLTETMLARYQSDNDGGRSNETFTDEEALILIHDASRSLMDSLATLMQVTEIKLNKEIPRDECDADTIINDTCNQLQSVIFEKQANLQKHVEVARISYPRVYLENIFYNLISNALKYTRPRIRPEIHVTTRMNNGRVQIIVKDNGLGIDMSKYGDKVFRLNEVFHQGFDSKGVGLYITKTQVESFGGTIELNSKSNEGCEFIVTL